MAGLVGGVAACVHEELLERGGLYAALVARDVADPVYLLAAMPGRTTVLLTGRGLGLIEPAVGIARELTPATVVLEDVDLVAAERTMPVGDNGVLFELLNQYGGSWELFTSRRSRTSHRSNGPSSGAPEMPAVARQRPSPLNASDHAARSVGSVP